MRCVALLTEYGNVDKLRSMTFPSLSPGRPRCSVRVAASSIDQPDRLSGCAGRLAGMDQFHAPSACHDISFRGDASGGGGGHRRGVLRRYNIGRRLFGLERGGAASAE